MKRKSGLLICAVIMLLFAWAFNANAAFIMRDEIQKGTLIAFDSAEGDFDTTTYYVKLLCEDGEECVYALEDSVYFEDRYCDAESITYKEELLNSEIAFAVRSTKIYSINPVMPEGAFDSVVVEACYKAGDKIYVSLSFENLVDKFTLVIATYNDGIMCASSSFEVPYTESCQEFEMDSNGGDEVKLFFLESIESMKPFYEVKKAYVPAKYGYLVSVKKADGEYEFEVFTSDGEFETFECAAEIVIDESNYTDGDSKVTNLLELSAESANEAYEDEVNVIYHQPVMYAVNEFGEIAHIDTVLSNVNSKISTLKKDDEGKSYYIPYGYKEFKKSSRTFVDFKVNSDTEIIFVPDDRCDSDSYIAYDSYQDAFINKRSYHIEAYGLSSVKNASLVLIYKENDNMIYSYKTPNLIVNSTISEDGNVYVTGYTGAGDTLKSVKVNTDKVESVDEIGKGDIIRYLTNNSDEMVDYTIWYDADNAVQNIPCDSMEEAISVRILELMSTRLEPAENYPNATFRLQYGTVWDIELAEEGNMMWVTSSVANDNFDMVTDGDGVVGWEIGDEVEIYKYDGENLITNADLQKIKAGETEVITYSASGKLVSIYIVKTLKQGMN